MGPFLLAMALLADPLNDPCRDDDLNDRCSAATQAEMRALYRVPPIDSYAAATVRRVFFVDGYGNDTIALEFIRAAGADAIIRVHSPKVKGEPPVAPMERLLTDGQWQQIIDASLNFDRKFGTEATESRADAGGEDEEIVLCLHSWVYWAEAIDPRGKSRSTVNDACNNQPVEQFAWFAAKLAVRVIPYCDALDRKLSRNEATLLLTCSGLSGDRLAAANVWNRARGFRFIDSPGGLDEFAAYDLELDFQGTRTSGQKARDLWRSLMIRPDAPNFFYDQIHGLNSEQVAVRGSFFKAMDEKTHQIADVELHWEDEGGTILLKSIKVGPYRPFSVPSE